MSDEEKCFPRGKAAVYPTSLKRKRVEKPDEKLFLESTRHHQSQKRGGKHDRAKRDDDKADMQDVDEFHSRRTTVDVLLFKNLEEGMSLLGCIKEIRELELVVSLPNSLVGFVKASHVSSLYTNALQEQIMMDENETIPNLTELFEVGQLLVCAVCGLNPLKRQIQLTLDPHAINLKFQFSKLQAGMFISGAIKSVEDHGYCVDVGKPGVNCFLPYSNTNPDVTLKPFQIVRCVVTAVKSNGKILTVSVQKKKLNKPMTKIEGNFSLDMMHPGMLVRFTTTKVFSVGKVGKVLGFDASVSVINSDITIPDDESAAPPKRKRRKGKEGDPEKKTHQADEDSSMIGCVLYVSASKHVVITTNSKVWRDNERLNNMSHFKEKYPVGQHCYLKNLTKIKGIGILGQIKSTGAKAIVYRKNLSDVKVDDNFSEFDNTKSLKARVVENLSVDGVLELSTKKSVLNALYFNYDDVTSGQLVSAKILKVASKGLQVVLGEKKDKEFHPSWKVHGFVPAMHMSDIILKHPEKKFNEGDIIKCRVLFVDPAKSKLHLTHKHTLVASKGPIITSYDQLKTGDIVHTFIVAIKEYGCLVKLFNNVKGLVPKREMSIKVIESMDKEFFVGQVMRSRVVSCNPEEKGLVLSFCMKAKTQAKGSLLKLGKMVDVEILSKEANGFNVLIVDDAKAKNDWKKAFLPTMHMSDFKSVAESRFASFQPGLKMEKCVIASTKPLHVTMKESIVKYWSASEMQSAVEVADMKTDQILPGFIYKVFDHHVLVRMPCHVDGYCPKAALADRYLATAQNYYNLDQSVIAKITEVDLETKRFKVTLRPSDTIDYQTDEERIKSYFKEREKLDENIKTDVGVKLGDVVTVELLKTGKDGQLRVKELSDSTYLGTMPCCEVGDGSAVVLHVDMTRKEVIMTNKKAVIEYAKSRKKAKVPPNSFVNVEVLYVTHDVTYGYVSSNGPGNGRLICLSTQGHVNHSNDPTYYTFTVGQQYEVIVIQTISGGVLLGSMQRMMAGGKRNRQDSELSTSSMGSQIAHEFGDLEIGEEIEVLVRSVKSIGVIVTIPSRLGSDGRPLTGRIHASEITEKPEHNNYPTRSIKVGCMLKCHVIGCRDVRTYEFLEITNRKAVRGVVELSLRRSRVEEKPLRERYSVGRKVVAFVKSFDKVSERFFVELEPGVRGAISKLLISPNTSKKVRPTHYVGSALHCTVLSYIGNRLQLSTKGTLVDAVSGDDVSDVRENCVTIGEVQSVRDDGLLIKTDVGANGRAFITDLFDEYIEDPLSYFSAGKVVRFRVLDCKDRYHMQLSLKKSLTCVGPDHVRHDDVITASSVTPGQLVKGYVQSCSKIGVFVNISRLLHGRVTLGHVLKHRFSLKEACKLLYPGRLVTCSVVSVDPQDGRLELSMLKEDVGLEVISLPKRAASEDDVERPHAKKSKLRLLSKSVVENMIYGATDEHTIEVKYDVNKPTKPDEPGFKWKSDDVIQPPSDEDSGIEEPEAQKVMSKQERTRKLLLEEEEIKKKEAELLDESRTPQSTADWERLLSSNPNNSLIWVRYMAFHLHAAETDKARAIAEKALKTINFREENEKLNVWVSLLNLENLYGSDVKMEETIQRALQQNDQLKVLNHVIDIYNKSAKHDKAEEIHKKLLKRFRSNKEVWLAYIRHLMVLGKTEEAGELFKKSLISIEKKSHLEVISKFAQMEFTDGDEERGRTLFENAISTYPKRTDVWSIYIDTLLKAKRIEDARDIFNRVTTLSLSSKKLKTFLKRFVEFETKYGNESFVKLAKQQAVNYLEMAAKKHMDDC